MNLKKVIFALGLFMMVQHMPALAEEPEVPEDIFRWVQSSARTNYFFNKEQICFEKDREGNVDTNILKVPVLKTYDEIMINDVVSKRRWNGLSLEGFGDFVGTSEYLLINLADNTVKIEEVNYLDSTWTTIDVVKPDSVVELEELSARSLDGKFYARIIDFAKRNVLVLAKRTDSEISEELVANLAKAQEEYREAHAPERPTDNLE